MLVSILVLTACSSLPSKEVSNDWKASERFALSYVDHDGKEKEKYFRGQIGQFAVAEYTAEEALYANNPNKALVLLWGNESDVQNTLRIEGINQDTGEKKIIIDFTQQDIRESDFADYEAMMLLADHVFDEAGVWKLQAFNDKKLLGEVVIEVVPYRS